MRAVLVLLVSVVVVGAQQGYPSSGYGAPPVYGPPQGQIQQDLFSQTGNAGDPSNNLNNNLPQGAPTEDPRPLIIKKHVFVHVAPDDRSSGIARRILAPIPRERQVNILFVKAPAPAAPDQQIVELPNDGGKKTLVYVLLKKADATPDVDFNLATPTQPSKPEIYFIRYKDGQKAGQLQKGGPGGVYGAPGAKGAGTAPQYGVPSQPPVVPAPNAVGGY